MDKNLHLDLAEAILRRDAAAIKDIRKYAAGKLGIVGYHVVLAKAIQAALNPFGEEGGQFAALIYRSLSEAEKKELGDTMELVMNGEVEKHLEIISKVKGIATQRGLVPEDPNPGEHWWEAVAGRIANAIMVERMEGEHARTHDTEGPYAGMAEEEFDIKDIHTMPVKQREMRLDTLLDKYNKTTDPEQKEMLQRQMRELRASISAAYGIEKCAACGTGTMAELMPGLDVCTQCEAAGPEHLKKDIKRFDVIEDEATDIADIAETMRSEDTAELKSKGWLKVSGAKKKCPEGWCDGTGLVKAWNPQLKKNQIEACDHCGLYGSDDEAEAAYEKKHPGWAKGGAKKLSSVALSPEAEAMRFDVYEDGKPHMSGVSFNAILEEYSSEAEIFENDEYSDLRAGEMDLFFGLPVGGESVLAEGKGVPTISIKRVA